MDVGDLAVQADAAVSARVNSVVSAMQVGQGKHGMQTFNQSLSDLIQRGLITREVGLARSSQPDELEMMLAEGKGLINRTAR